MNLKIIEKVTRPNYLQSFHLNYKDAESHTDYRSRDIEGG